MQASQVMSQAGVLAFNPSHIGFADDLVALRNELRINGITIGDPEVAGPVFDPLPQGCKGSRAVVTDDPI